MSHRYATKALGLVAFLVCVAAPAATPVVNVAVTLANKGGRIAYERSDNSIISDPAGPDGYRDVWRYTLDAKGNIATSTCITCDNPEMPFHNGNPRYDPFGRGFMFQVENKACPAAAIGNSGSPGAGACNDFWWWSAGNQQVYRVSAPLPAYNATYAQMHGKWSKNADYFIFGYRLPGECRDTFGCNIGGAWELHAVEVSWTSPAPNVYVPQFGTVHVYSPGSWPNHFYQMTGTSPVDNGVILFESNSFRPVTSPGDIDVATMRIRAEDGTWLTNEQANATVVVISEFSTDGSHTDEWNELAEFVPDGTQIQWMSSRGYPPATSLLDLYSDYWRCNPDGSNKRQISFFNTPGYPEYTGQRTIASNYSFQNVTQFFSYIYHESTAPDNIYRIQVPVTASVVVTNAATFLATPGVAPGSLASAFVPAVTGISSAVAKSFPWPDNLAGVQLKVNDVAARLYYAGPGQINFQVPVGTRLGQANIQVIVNNATVATGTATIVEASPGIFLTNSVSLQGAVLNQNSLLNAVSIGARHGEVIQIFATGAGPLLTPVLDGLPAAPYSNTRSAPKVYFGDTEATVQFSGVTGFPGLWQINAYVPAKSVVTGLVPIVVVQNGVQSNQATLWISN